MYLSQQHVQKAWGFDKPYLITITCLHVTTYQHVFLSINFFFFCKMQTKKLCHRIFKRIKLLTICKARYTEVFKNISIFLPPFFLFLFIPSLLPSFHSSLDLCLKYHIKIYLQQFVLNLLKTNSQDTIVLSIVLWILINSDTMILKYMKIIFLYWK